jgi:hypothetical protein
MTATLIRLAVGKRTSALTAIVSPVARFVAEIPIVPGNSRTTFSSSA